MRRLVALGLFAVVVQSARGETVYRAGQRVRLAQTGMAIELPGPTAGWEVYSVEGGPNGKPEDAYDVIAQTGTAKLLVEVRFVAAKSCDDWRKTYVPDGATEVEEVAYWPREYAGVAKYLAVFENKTAVGWTSTGCARSVRGTLEAVIYADAAPTKAQAALLLKLTTAMLEAGLTATAPSSDPQTVQAAIDLDEMTTGVRGSGPLTATIATSNGTITCRLFADKAPIAVANFIGLARGRKSFYDSKQKRWMQRAFYDGLTIHRVIPGFVIQGGDLDGDGTGGVGYTIKNEDGNGLMFDRPGKLATARGGDPDSAGGQFFITDGPATHLDGHQTIFGECAPQATIHAIASVPHNSVDRPTKPVTITGVKITR